MTNIKIYGERNSGTNYLERLIAANINCVIYPGNLRQPRRSIYLYIKTLLPNILGHKLVEADRDRVFKYNFKIYQGWKHAQIPCHQYSNAVYKEGVCFLTITKNPYAWLLSLYKRPYANIDLINNKPDFSTFLRSRWKTVARECGPLEYVNPIEMWNAKTSSYSELSQYGSHLHLRYEEILEDPKNAVSMITSTFEMKNISTGFKDIEKSTKLENYDTNDYKVYYANQCWQEKLSKTDIEYINTQLDYDLVEKIGYKIISPV